MVRNEGRRKGRREGRGGGREGKDGGVPTQFHSCSYLHSLVPPFPPFLPFPGGCR